MLGQNFWLRRMSASSLEEEENKHLAAVRFGGPASSSTFALWYLSNVTFQLGDVTAAIRAMRRLALLSPEDAEVHDFLAWMVTQFVPCGRDEARRLFARAEELELLRCPSEPLSEWHHYDMGWLELMHFSDYRRAWQHFAKAAALNQRLDCVCRHPNRFHMSPELKSIPRSS